MRRNDVSMTDLSGVDNDPKVYHVRKSRMIRLVNWWTVSATYLPYLLLAAVGVLVAQVAQEAVANWDSLAVAYDGYRSALSTSPAVAVGLGWRATALVVAALWWLGHRRTPVYLLDFAVFEPPASWKVTHEQLIEIMRRQKCFTHDSIEFMARILANSGTSQSTAWPPSITRCLQESSPPSDRSVDGARAEAEAVMYDIVAKALAKTHTDPRDIDILVVNCSLFSPTPSLCSMIIHKFGLRSDVRSFNLAGMGCSAGIIAVDLARDLLMARPNSIALVVSTENLTQNLYHGNDRSMLLQNTLFRCGGAAIVLSNKWQDAMRAKFKLLTTIRTQGEGLDAYECVFECEDDLGHRGVRLSKQIVEVAGKAMQDNFTALGPHVLPLSEQIPTIKSYAAKYLCRRLTRVLEKRNPALAAKVPRPRTYIPDFKRGIDHFCIHAGGRGVIDGIEKTLKLSQKQTLPSREALSRYGNTSSSSIWYEMDFILHNQDLKRGQRILQVAFGSGFKCNSAVWLCLNTHK
ncbi:3-ketoacyl-CoA synthase [Tribonema minus]|uniref:3-ketoacyl-CoA synthase n=1 Tax=Tribonema minus TaxID=303371 RepID=A0A835YTW0_9STRA|nr:3-ketoacyl-CoA synthase [Tribonema minus]